MKKAKNKKVKDKKVLNSVIAERRTCDADGVGLSHYILMEKKVK